MSYLGLGQAAGPTIDQLYVRAAHALAERIVAAREAGKHVEERQLREMLDAMSAIYRGFASEAEKRVVVEEALAFDPLGVKGLANIAGGVGRFVALGGMAMLALYFFQRGARGKPPLPRYER
ncbi:MAG: hypothetical protein GY906_38610 [bacterium]|nr:hypothetical protein [bacterium]